MTGSEFAAAIQTMAPDAIQALILQCYASGSVPQFITDRPWRGVNSSMVTPEGKTRNLFLYVSPVLAVGTDLDPFFPPMRPETLQIIATRYKSIIVTPTIVDLAFKSAPAKIPLLTPRSYKGRPLVIGGTSMDMTAPSAFAACNDLIVSELKRLNVAPTDAAGFSKNVVIGPGLDGSRVAIYGGYNPSPGGPHVDGWAYQGYPGPHEVAWVDYSQRGQLVFGRSFLDGVETNTTDIFTDPTLVGLVFRGGPAFNPVFPSKGSGASNPPKPPTRSGPTSGGDRLPPPRDGGTSVSQASDAGMVGAVAALAIGAALVASAKI